LAPGVVGVVITEEEDKLKVRAKNGGDREWWYRPAALVLSQSSAIRKPFTVADWDMFFAFVRDCGHPVAGFVVWSFRLFDQSIFHRFASNNAGFLSRVTQTSELLAALLASDWAPKLAPPLPPAVPKIPDNLRPPMPSVMPNSPLGKPLPALPREPENWSLAPQEIKATDSVAEGKQGKYGAFTRASNAPETPAVPAAPSPDLMAKIEFLMSREHMRSTMLGVPVLVRHANEGKWVEFVINPGDSLEALLQKAAQVLGKPRNQLKRVEKLLGDMSVTVTDVRGLSKHEKLVVFSD